MCRISVTRSVRPIHFAGCTGGDKCNKILTPTSAHTPQEIQAVRNAQKQQRRHHDIDEATHNRSTMCAICNVDTGSFNLNYGANTCLSCRAFFRRAIQKTRTPNFVCKFGGNCVITEETRRTCKKCRFDKCQQAGMNPDCVMEGGQIHQRFFKYIQKKKGVDKKASTMARLVEEGIKAEELAMKQAKNKISKSKHSTKKHIPYMPDLMMEAMRELLDSSSPPQIAAPQIATPQIAAPQIVPVVVEPVYQPAAYQMSPNVMLSCPQQSYQYKDLMCDNDSAYYSSSSVCSASPQQDNVSRDDDFAALFDLELLPSQNNDCNGQINAPIVVPVGQMFNRNNEMETNNRSDEMIPEDCDVMTLFENVSDRPIMEIEIKKDPEPQEEQIEIKSECDRIEPDETRMIEKVKHARRTWSEVCQEEKSHHAFVTHITKALSSAHSLPNSILEELKAKHEKVFRRFAFKQSEFLALSENDQLLLLSKNTQVFVQYLIGRALSAQDVSQQLQWLLLSEETIEFPQKMQDFMRKIRLDDLQTFTDSVTFEEYRKCTRQLSTHEMQFPCTGNVALVCLFQTESIFSVLEAPKEIALRQDFIYSCAEWAHNIFNSAGRVELANIMATLHSMASMAESLNLVADCERILALPELAILLAREEEDGWIKQKLEAFDEALKGISFGPDFVKECVMYSLGVPLSKHFIPEGTRIWIERFRTILFSHEEFVSGLNQDEQSEALVPATFAAFALTKAKLEICKSGNEQFKLAFSNTDNAIVQEAFALRSGTPRMKRVSVREWNKTSGLMSEESEKKFSQLVENLSGLIENDESFKLLTLLAMFAHLSTTSSGSQMAVVAQRYLNALKHRFAIKGEEAEFESKVKKALCDVRELSVILQHASDAAMAKIHGN